MVTNRQIKLIYDNLPPYNPLNIEATKNSVNDVIPRITHKIKTNGFFKK